MPNNYNGIAKYYDRLSRVIYGKSIVKAQKYLIKSVSGNDSILLAGGGTGWILEEIAALQKQNISVVYVEKSSAMIRMAQKRRYENIKVTFIHEAIEDYHPAKNFDIIFTPFLFDNFLAEKINTVFSKLDSSLRQGGLWLYADFINDKAGKKYWQQFLLKTMYVFFKITTRIEAGELINMQPLFSTGYEMVEQNFFYNHFIQATVYRKR